jgi:hypothetical protein
MNEEKPRRGLPKPFGNQENGRHRLDAIQIKHKAFENISIVFLDAEKLRWTDWVMAWKIAEHLPEIRTL